ncbi:hypothetical protein EER27_07365 [Lysobacter psychrotolerans]|uniref:Tetratricopeptide repeat protein n=1 Tax=Montanilutibacter psychrotolerans TaxID=1327343 RepID=A0A3M8SUT0_9GAMM|nr:hypothetical protein EER27_07365 [Lysobacter psychrotolerans]
MLALALVLGLLRRPLSDWLWPDTRGQQLRHDAAAALREGRLSAADGTGARELYAAAVALDPDRPDARDGLARVGRAALVQAETALADGRIDDARSALMLARELQVPRAKADTLAMELRRREAALAGIDGLLESAAAARAAGRLEGAEDAALPLYQRVLALQPNHTTALEGREDILADLLQQARKRLARGELVEAAGQIRQVQAADAGHVDLPDALSDLVGRIEQRRRRADRDLRGQRLGPALAGYRELVAIAPDDAEAARGLAAVASAHARRSQRLAADFQFDLALAALREAEAADASVAEVAVAREHLQRARRSQAQLRDGRLDRDQRARLRQLLHEAAAAEARGELLEPPGESAFDRVRAARALAPRDPDVQAASARLLPAARTCFEDALRGNRLVRARACLDASAVLEGEGARVQAARRRLAQRWIAVGDERLGAGELQAARVALDAARALDPDAAGLDEFASRVQAATLGD